VVKSDGGVSRISIEDIKKALLEEESQMRSQNEVKAAKI
jgi:hypothetical protein